MEKIKVPNDIREYEDKLKIGISLTYREWISVALTLIVPWLLNKQLILLRAPELLRNVIIYGLVFMFACYGFMNFYGMKFEKFIFYFLRYLFSPTKEIQKKEGDLLDL